MAKTLVSASIAERLTHALSPEKIKWFGTKMLVNPSYYTGFAVMLFIVISCVLIRIFLMPKLKNVPGKLQSILEMFVSGFNGMTHSSFLASYLMATAVYIAIGTLVEFVGIRPVLADLNACVALGVFTFTLIVVYGFKSHGKKRAKHYLNPINVITDIAVPVSMSFRLFGSIISGFLIMELVYSFVATSIVIPIAVGLITTVFHAFIQAYVFSSLSSLFVEEACEIDITGIKPQGKP